MIARRLRLANVAWNLATNLDAFPHLTHGFSTLSSHPIYIPASDYGWTPPPSGCHAVCHTTFYHTTSATASSRQASDEPDQEQDGDVIQDEETLKTLLLDTAVKHVKDCGWSNAAIQAAAQELGLSPMFAGIVTKGETALVEHFITQCNANLVQQLTDLGEEYKAQGMTNRISQAVRMRLEMLVPYIDSWPQALAILARPNNASTALRLMHEIVDSIWIAAGDKSHDLSWYSKRLLLAGVYSSTELYMLTDFSPDYADTWAALDRRLEDIVSLGKSVSQYQTLLKDKLRI